jgi:hypothetical protein
VPLTPFQSEPIQKTKANTSNEATSIQSPIPHSTSPQKEFVQLESLGSVITTTIGSSISTTVETSPSQSASRESLIPTETTPTSQTGSSFLFTQQSEPSPQSNTQSSENNVQKTSTFESTNELNIFHQTLM